MSLSDKYEKVLIKTSTKGQGSYSAFCTANAQHNGRSYRFSDIKFHCIISQNPRRRTKIYDLLGYLPLAL